MMDDTETAALKARLRTAIPMIYGKEATKIQVIKMVRILIPGIGLKEAKDLTEWAIEGDTYVLPSGKLVHDPENRTVTYHSSARDDRGVAFGGIVVCRLAYDYNDDDGSDRPYTRWHFDSIDSYVASEVVKVCKDRWGF